MKRPWVLAIAAASIFGVGVGAGWWLRGVEVVTTALGGEAGVTAAPASDDEAAARAAVDPAVDGGPGRAVAAGGAAGAESGPRGAAGDVAVIGGGSASARSTGSGEAAPATAGAPGSSGDAGVTPRGRLDAQAIRDVVRSQRDQLGFCFAWQLHSHPELRGRLIMEFVIGPDGTVTRAEVADDALGDETVSRCFANVTRRMRFPPPEGGEVTVRYPFELSPDDEEEDADRPSR